MESFEGLICQRLHNARPVYSYQNKEFEKMLLLSVLSYSKSVNTVRICICSPSSIYGKIKIPHFKSPTVLLAGTHVFLGDATHIVVSINILYAKFELIHIDMLIE